MKRKVLIVVGVFASIFVLEAVDISWTAYRIYSEYRDIMALQKDVFSEKGKTSCAERGLKSQFACFKEHAKPTLERNLDATGTILLLAVGVSTVINDQSDQLCAKEECKLNLTEFTLDTLDPIFKKDLPSRYSPFLSAHVERQIIASFATSFVDKASKMMDDLASEANNQKEGSTKIRTEQLLKRYSELKPLILTHQEGDFLFCWLKGYLPLRE